MTRAEILEALQAAHEAGHTDAAASLAELYDNTPPDVSEKLRDPNTMLGSTFGAVDDFTGIAQDAFTRGWGDKLFGSGAQAETRAARERMPDSAELTADILGSVAGSPYRVGGAIAGGLTGGLEGVANAYGHQDNWVPSLSDVGNMAWEGGKGAVLGSGLGAVGKKIGDWIGTKTGTAAQKYKTDDALNEDTTRLLRRNPSSAKGAALAERYARVRAAREAQGEGTQDAFKKLIPSSPAEKAAQDALTKGPGVVRKGLNIADQFLLGPMGDKAKWAAAGETVLHGFPGFGTLAALGAKGASAAIKNTGKNLSPKDTEAFIALLRDPKGTGMTDPALANAARDLLAKIGVGGGKSFNQ